jgi:rhamnose transport system permease protein
MTSHVSKGVKPRINILDIFSRYREVGLIVFILLLVIVVTLRAPAFLSVNNLTDILMNISILLIVALGQTMVILTKGIDLSVSSMIGLVAMMVAFVMKENPGTPVFVIVVLGMALGTVAGLFNSIIITIGKVPPIIATLGTLSVYRGLVFYYSSGTWINSFELPASIKMLSKGRLLGLPNLIVIAFLIAIIVYLFLKYTRTGRNIFAVGSNVEAAEYAGVRPQRIVFLVYLLSGMLAGLGAVLWVSRFESAQTNTALGFELQTVTAAVIGGVSISGGVGTIPGVILGALLLGMIQNSLTLVRISPFWQLAAQGLLIIIAVVIDKVISTRAVRTIK